MIFQFGLRFSDLEVQLSFFKMSFFGRFPSFYRLDFKNVLSPTPLQLSGGGSRNNLISTNIQVQEVIHNTKITLNTYNITLNSRFSFTKEPSNYSRISWKFMQNMRFPWAHCFRGLWDHRDETCNWWIKRTRYLDTYSYEIKKSPLSNRKLIKITRWY